MLAHSQGYRGFEFLRLLINDMMLDEPSEQLKMDEVHRRFQDIANGLGTWKLRSAPGLLAATQPSSKRLPIFFALEEEDGFHRQTHPPPFLVSMILFSQIV